MKIKQTYFKIKQKLELYNLIVKGYPKPIRAVLGLGLLAAGIIGIAIPFVPLGLITLIVGGKITYDLFKDIKEDWKTKRDEKSNKKTKSR